MFIFWTVHLFSLYSVENHNSFDDSIQIRSFRIVQFIPAWISESLRQYLIQTHFHIRQMKYLTKNVEKYIDGDIGVWVFFTRCSHIFPCLIQNNDTNTINSSKTCIYFSFFIVRWCIECRHSVKKIYLELLFMLFRANLLESHVEMKKKESYSTRSKIFPLILNREYFFIGSPSPVMENRRKKFFWPNEFRTLVPNSSA